MDRVILKLTVSVQASAKSSASASLYLVVPRAKACGGNRGHCFSQSDGIGSGPRVDRRCRAACVLRIGMHLT